jgi:hypothetical protein
MRLPLRSMALAGFLAIGGLVGLGTSTAKAQGHGDHHDGGHGDHHGGGYGGQYGGGYGGGYGVPSYNYYGNGGHDAQPHWHTRQTPYGSYSYYGLGRHDFRPHGHTVTPYGIESYNGRRTRSYSPPTPYTYRPW